MSLNHQLRKGAWLARNFTLSTINLLCFLALFVPAFFAPTATAGERSVTAAEATGTYRDVEGKSEIRILALGHGKLKVQLALVYEFKKKVTFTATMHPIC